MTPEPVQLTLNNICQGAVPEVFAREVRSVLENIADINTSADGKRKIVLTFEFEPTADRRSATVSFQCTSKTLSVEVKVGTIYFAKRSGRMEAYASDPRQEVLFGEEPTNSSTKQ
jgi:hypothetical protein